MANDFSTDSRVKALWRFESGALTTDSIGGNTLTPSASAPTADTSEYREGSGSVNFASSSSQYYQRADADLPDGFPLKNNDTVKKGAICLWFRLTSLISYECLFNKGNYNNNLASFWIRYYNNNIEILWGYGTSGRYLETFKIPCNTINRWFHLGVSFDGVNKILYARIYDSVTTVATTYAFSPSNTLRVVDSPLVIGGEISGSSLVNPLNGKIDEVVIANDLLGIQEIDLVRAGNFNSSYWNSLVGSSGVQAVYLPTPQAQVGSAGARVVYLPTSQAQVGSAGARAVYKGNKAFVEQAAVSVLFKNQPTVVADTAAILVLWGQVPHIWVEQVSNLVLWSDVAQDLTPDSVVLPLLCEDIPPACDPAILPLACEGIELPTPDDIYLPIACSSPPSGAPDDALLTVNVPAIPLTYGTGMFMTF
jgi:hypothetical protein